MPPLLTPTILVPAVAIMLVASIVKGSIGFGLPLIGVPLLALLMDAKVAVVVVSIPVFAANVLLLIRRPVEPAIIRRLVPLMATMVPTTVVGSFLLIAVSAQAISVVVGAACVIFAALSVARIRLVIPPHVERVTSPILGLGAGLLYGATSILGPVFALYLDALGMSQQKRAFVYGLTLLFATGNIVQVTSYVGLGLYSDGLLFFGALLAVAALIGQQLGFMIQDRLDPVRFRQLVVLVVALSSLVLVLRGLGIA